MRVRSIHKWNHPSFPKNYGKFRPRNQESFFWKHHITENFGLRSTLVFLIIVQVVKTSKINKSARWNKAMQVGIFGSLLLQIKDSLENHQILINVKVGIRAWTLGNFWNLIKFAALLFGRLKYVGGNRLGKIMYFSNFGGLRQILDLISYFV